jgi:hypothetical protein
MKTLFLFAVLFILVAFAFKEPNQSAWDFTRDVASSVSNKVAPGPNDEIEQRPKFNNAAPVKEDARTFDDHLSRVEKFIKPNPTISLKPKPNPTPKPAPKPAPKPRSSVATKTELVEKAASANSMNKSKVGDISEPKITSEPAPDLQAKPIPKVAREKLTPPRIEPPRRPAYRPINVDELAEMGRRYDRASRLLSEIK